jgi:hypothetical protein
MQSASLKNPKNHVIMSIIQKTVLPKFNLIKSVDWHGINSEPWLDRLFTYCTNIFLRLSVDAALFSDFKYVITSKKRLPIKSQNRKNFWGSNSRPLGFTIRLWPLSQKNWKILWEKNRMIYILLEIQPSCFVGWVKNCSIWFEKSYQITAKTEYCVIFASFWMKFSLKFDISCVQQSFSLWKFRLGQKWSLPAINIFVWFCQFWISCFRSIWWSTTSFCN